MCLSFFSDTFMAEKQTDEEQVKKSPMKLILIIVGALLLLAAGGAGGYFFMKMSAEKEHAAKGDAHGDAHAKQEEHHEAEKHEAVAEPDVYVDLPSPLLVNFPSGSDMKIIKVSITLLMKGESGVAALKKHEPMIRNNLMMAISALGAEKAKTVEGKNALRATMLTEIGKVLEMMAGKNTVKEVYFTEFVMQ